MTFTNDQIYQWLGDDADDLDNLILIIADIANGDYDPQTLNSDIAQALAMQDAH